MSVFRTVARGVLAAAVLTGLDVWLGPESRLNLCVSSLVFVQAISILCLRLFSREANALSLKLVGLIVASALLLCFSYSTLVDTGSAQQGGRNVGGDGTATLPTLNIDTPISALIGTILYLFFVRFPTPPLRSLDDHIVVVTGSSSGIGLETASQLLALNATVVFACRTETKAREAMKRITSKLGGDSARRTIFVRLDLSSVESVKACAREIKDRIGRCDVLVCNAGAFSSRREVNALVGSMLHGVQLVPVIPACHVFCVLFTVETGSPSQVFAHW